MLGPKLGLEISHAPGASPLSVFGTRFVWYNGVARAPGGREGLKLASFRKKRSGQRALSDPAAEVEGVGWKIRLHKGLIWIAEGPAVLRAGGTKDNSPSSASKVPRSRKLLPGFRVADAWDKRFLVNN